MKDIKETRVQKKYYKDAIILRLYVKNSKEYYREYCTRKR